MKALNRRKTLLAASILLAAVGAFYNNCSNVRFEPSKEIIIGNPMAPVSSQLLYAVCGVITRCHLQISAGQCQAALLTTSGFASPLGIPSTYSDFSSILQGEQSGALIGNLSQASTCTDSLAVLSCSDSNVAVSYDPSLSNPFANAAAMVPASSCNQVFSPPLQYACSNSIILAVGQPASWAPSQTSTSGFSVTPALPPGLSLNAQTGVISGTPTAASPSAVYTMMSGSSSTTLTLQVVQGYVVNDLGDATDANPGDHVCETSAGSGKCTLRAAVAEANADGAGSWNIILPEGTVTLGSSLSLANSINIYGTCRDTSIIDGAGGSYDALTMGASNTLSVQNLTIQNSGGSGISHGFNNTVGLTATNVRFENNGGPAVAWMWNYTTANFTNCIFEGNKNGAVTVSRTNGSATFTGCVFDNNSGGNALFIPNTPSTINVVNSTFYKNTGGAAIYVNDPGPTVNIVNATIADNIATTGPVGGTAGGIFIWGNLSIQNTIVANNTATVTGSSSNCFANVAALSKGGNLVWPPDAQCGFTNSSDLTPADPMLGAFQNYGGPTFTLSLLTGSPAIDAGVVSGCPTVDQRGVARLTDGKCDVGAYESRP